MKLNVKRTVLVGCAFLLICAFWAAYEAIVPLMLVNKFGLNQTWSGIIMALDNVIALVLLPIFGAFSDKTETRFGRRTPYIVIGTIVAVILFVGLSFADNMQLKNVREISGSSYEKLWEQNGEISNAEKFSDGGENDYYNLQDYVCLIVNNKKLADCNSEEILSAKDWFLSINSEFGKDKPNGWETYYHYENGYSTVEVSGENGNYVYTLTSSGEIVSTTELKNAFANLITPARSLYSAKLTSQNKLPLIVFIGVLFLLLLAMSLFRSPAVALMPDVTVRPLRSQGNAVINLMGALGTILVLILGFVLKTGKSYNQMMSYTQYILCTCAIMVIALVIFIIFVKEKKWTAEMRADSVKYGIIENEEEGNSHKKLSKPELKSLIFLLLSVAFWYMGYNAVTSKISLYALNVLHKDYNVVMIVANVAAIISYVPVGILATKIGRKKSILIGVAILTLSFAGIIFLTESSSAIILYVLFSLAGVGWATINVNSFPMVVELASGGDTGKYTGFYYTASMAVQAITPVLSGVLMDVVGSMSPLFYYATFFTGLSFITMLFVKHGDNIPSKKKNVLENFDIDD